MSSSLKLYEEYRWNKGTEKTPAKYETLLKDKNGDHHFTKFNYFIIVGILFYLQIYSKSELIFLVMQYERYTYCFQLYHKNSLKIIGCE